MYRSNKTRSVIVEDDVGLALEATLAALNSLIGEVQADPTTNTLLDRLKGLLTGIVLAGGSATIGGIIEQATPVITPATGAGAISTSYAPSAAFWLDSITVHFSAAPTTSQDLTVTLNASDGGAYDTILFSEDPSATSATDIFFAPESPLLCESGDAIDVAFTGTDGATFGLRIVTRLA